MTVHGLINTLSTLSPSLPLYGSCCTILGVRINPTSIDIIAPPYPGEDPRWPTVGHMLTVLAEIDPARIVTLNGRLVRHADAQSDYQGPFADISAER